MCVCVRARAHVPPACTLLLSPLPPSLPPHLPALLSVKHVWGLKFQNDHRTRVYSYFLQSCLPVSGVSENFFFMKRDIEAPSGRGICNTILT